MKASQGTGILQWGDGKHDQEVQSTLDEDETLQCGGDDQNYIVEATQRVRIL